MNETTATETTTTNIDDQFPAYIPDGYTRPGYVEAKKYLHPAFSFTYRPVLSRERVEIASQQDSLSKVKQEEKAAEILAKALKSWGLPVPMTAANVLRLEPSLFATMFLIVMGYRTTDPNPAWSEDKQADLCSELREELDAKN